MVAYNLQCCNQHQFEGWFKDTQSFKQQLIENLVECPLCGTNDISQLPSAPNISKKQEKKNHTELADIHDNARKMVAHIHDNFENVDDKFPEEIRKIHYKKSPARDIYGKANMQELHDLHEEGIDCNIMPDFENTN